MHQLGINIVRDGAKIKFEFHGTIDEDAVFPPVPANAQEFIFNLESVSGINSCGVREWVRWTSGFAPSIPVKIERAPKSFIDQVNMVDGFLPKHFEVQSFHVPYYCETCDDVTNVLLVRGTHFTSGNLKVEEAGTCATCSKETELDVIRDKYFRFVA